MRLFNFCIYVSNKVIIAVDYCDHELHIGCEHGGIFTNTSDNFLRLNDFGYPAENVYNLNTTNAKNISRTFIRCANVTSCHLWHKCYLCVIALYLRCFCLFDFNSFFLFSHALHF